MKQICYIEYMQKCIELAKLGQGETSPNPLVGCVVLDKNGNLISTGYHKKYGENHAECDALLKLKNGEEKDGTLIVNLEPCSHFGKTPPCADLIIERGIKNVIIGMKDVNPIVSGNGIKKLLDAGINVQVGGMEEECKKLNEIFITNFTEKRTFVALKTATTLDGKIATSTGSSKWITSENARNEVKNIRKRYDAILTSSSTVILDNPMMEHKTKIILDRTLKSDFKQSKIYQSGRCFVFYDENLSKPAGVHENIVFIPCPVKKEYLDLGFVFDKLFELKIMSVLVEAGARVNGSVLRYVDKVYHFIAPKIAGDNSCKSCFDFQFIKEISECENFRFDSTKVFEPDILLTYYR